MPEIINKTALRRTLLEARKALTAELRVQWDAAIGSRIMAWWEMHPVRTLGVYWPIQNEPDVRRVYDVLADCGVQLALPVVTGNAAPLKFVAWTPGDTLVKDAMGVSIPAKADAFMHPEAILVPCVGFNATRIRLGYGGGFYDRTLALSPRPLAIGIGYACALATFHGAPHDIALDMIFTEASCISAD